MQASKIFFGVGGYARLAVFRIGRHRQMTHGKQALTLGGVGQDGFFFYTTMA